MSSIVDQHYFDLIRELAKTQFRLRDQSTVFGFLWSFMSPLIMLTVLYVFFKDRVGQDIENYGIYLLIGVIVYTHFAKTTGTTMTALVSLKNLTTSVILPKEAIVLSGTLAFSVEFAISMFIMLIFALLSGIPISASWLLMPIVIVMQLLLLNWISMALAATYVFVRDIDYIYEIFIRLLFFMTPIFYSVESMHGIARLILLFNPLTYVIVFARQLIIEGVVPDLMAMFFFLLLNIVANVIVWYAFKYYEPAFNDYL